MNLKDFNKVKNRTEVIFKNVNPIIKEDYQFIYFVFEIYFSY